MITSLVDWSSERNSQLWNRKQLSFRCSSFL